MKLSGSSCRLGSDLRDATKEADELGWGWGCGEHTWVDWNGMRLSMSREQREEGGPLQSPSFSKGRNTPERGLCGRELELGTWSEVSQ